jgi:TolB protein
MRDVDTEIAESFERIYPDPAPTADWDDVLDRARGHRGVNQRRVVLVVAALLFVVVASASAFSTVRERLFGERRIAAGAATWSPDGRRIAFVTVGCTPKCSSDGAVGLNVMNADGSGQRSLTRELSLDGIPRHTPLPVWSRDLRKLAFVQERGPERGYPVYGRYSDVYVINADGSGRRQLTRSSQNDGDPVWSPDGRRLAFVRVVGGLADLYVVNADGSGLRRLAHIGAGRMGRGYYWFDYYSNPAWSPDGRRIAFVSNRRGNDDVYVVNADGSGLRKVSRSPRNEGDPLWSPDGRVIVFQGPREPPSEAERAVCRGHCMRGELFVVNADGTGLRRLTRNWKDDSPAAWSPDGRKLLLGRSGDIWAVNADGSGQRNLTPSATQPLAEHGGATWSPDGRKILFVSNRGDGNWFEVYVMNADGSGKRQLTHLKGRD